MTRSPTGPQRAALVLAFALLAAPMSLGAAPLTVSVRDGKGEPVEDVVVLARGGASKPAPGGGKAIVDQIDKEFVPWVAVVGVGTAVTFPNKDNIRHHVYSFSPARKFELPLYAGTPAAPVTFDKAGVVALGCNIHDWMVGYVVVTDAPAFGKTDATGSLSLDLGPGTWQLTLWHPAIKGGKEGAPQPVTVGAAGATLAELTIELDPTKKHRRAPRPGDKDY